MNLYAEINTIKNRIDLVLDRMEVIARTINLAVLNLFMWVVMFILLPYVFIRKMHSDWFKAGEREREYLLIADTAKGVKWIHARNTYEAAILTGIHPAVLQNLRRASKNATVDPAFRIRVQCPKGELWKMKGMY